jgi:pilus assembly protein CpaE
LADGIDVRRGNIRTAISAMAALKTPDVLIVDISGEEQPLNALDDLAQTVEPGVILLVLGDTDDIGFYRNVTHGMGAMEYLPKPISRDAVARCFVPFITRKTADSDLVRGGRVIAVIGAQSGVGTTTIAANLAWYLGVIENRHTVIVEADLYMSSGTLLVGGKAGHGLRMALEAPERIDPLFVERAAQPVAKRLSILESQEKLGDPLNYSPGAAQRLIETLRQHYNYTILDVPFVPSAFHQELLEFNHHRVIVTDPSLAGIRDTLRLLELPKGIWQPQRPTLVLNRQGLPGALTRHEIEKGEKIKFDVVIPYLPDQLNESARFGEPAVARHGAFHNAIVGLSHEVGFVGGHREQPSAGNHISTLGLTLKNLIPHRDRS